VIAFRTFASLLALLLAGQASAAGDPVAGKVAFRQRCAICHADEPGGRSGMGPNLFGVYGRRAGTGDFASYSTELKASGLVWSNLTLDRFLAGPTKLVPGARMAISVPDAAQRADIVAYLATLKK
jgi:cytochrome c